jgi:hypothetical protein
MRGKMFVEKFVKISMSTQQKRGEKKRGMKIETAVKSPGKINKTETI